MDLDLEITPYDAAQASSALVAEVYDATMRMFTQDRPGEQLPTLEAFGARLRMTTTSLGARLNWVVRSDGRTVGTAFAILLDAENRDMAMLEVRVVPESRRQGIGTAVMRSVLPEVRAAGRKVVVAFDVRVGGAGEVWAAAVGFRRTHEMVLQTLEVSDVDPALWSVPAPLGFSAARWADAAPDGLVASFAAARTAIRDAPRGEMRYAEPEWTVQRVREHEEADRRRGVEQRVVAAVHEATGRIAGLTVIETQPQDSAMALQQDTAVLAEFRGHGLGRYMKAEMMRWLLADRPSIQRVTTQTASSNVHMIQVNRQLGYTTTATMATVEAEVDELLSRS